MVTAGCGSALDEDHRVEGDTGRGHRQVRRHDEHRDRGRIRRERLAERLGEGRDVAGRAEQGPHPQRVLQARAAVGGDSRQLGEDVVDLRGDLAAAGRGIGDLKIGAKVQLAVRPEDLEILTAVSHDPPPGGLCGVIEAALFVGERVEYQIHVEQQHKIVAYGDRHTPAAPGATVWLKPRPRGTVSGSRISKP